MKTLKAVALILLIIGGLNWGLISLVGFATIFGKMPIISRILYGLIGLAAVYMAFISFTEETKSKPKIETKTDFE